MAGDASSGSRGRGTSWGMGDVAWGGTSENPQNTEKNEVNQFSYAFTLLDINCVELLFRSQHRACITYVGLRKILTNQMYRKKTETPSKSVVPLLRLFLPFSQSRIPAPAPRQNKCELSSWDWTTGPLDHWSRGRENARISAFLPTPCVALQQHWHCTG